MLTHLSKRAVFFIVIGLLVGEPIRWGIGRALDSAYEKWGGKVLKTALELINAVQPYWIAALIGAAAIVLVANLGRLVVGMKSFISGISFVGKDGKTGGGIRVNAMQVEMDDVAFEGFNTAIDLNDAGGSRLSNVEASNSTVGFSIKNSPGVNASNARSVNNTRGFEVEDSPDVDLSNAVAEQRKPTKDHQVKLPDGMKKKT